MSAVSRSLAVILGLGLLFAAGCATLNSTSATPEDTVQRFLKLDFDGMRLSGSTYPKVEPLVTWKTQPDADPVYLVSGYTITGSKIEGDRAEVLVKYDMINRIAVTWKPSNPDLAKDLQDNSLIAFKLVRRGSAWKIDEPRLTPHASPQALARVIRSWPQSGARGNDQRLQDTLKYLDSLTGQK